MASIRSSKFRMSLAFKFLAAISIFIFIIIPLATYLYFTTNIEVLNEEAAQKAKILKENLKDKGVSMSRNIALNISSAVAGMDFTFLQNVISSTVASDKDVRYAIISNQEGRALVHSDPLKALHILDSPQDKKSHGVQKMTLFEFPMEDEEIIEVAIPIMLDEERWGTLRMGYTLQFLNTAIRESADRAEAQKRALTRTTLLIAALSMIAGTILSILFSRHIVKAIRAIVKTTEKVAQGDFSPRVHIRTRDELESLGNAINVMTENLEKLTKENIQKARMESELHTAELVQSRIIPKKDPNFSHLEFASYLRSASETGGDWYTYVPQPDETILSMVIADVTGHGLPAALLTEAAHSCFQTINKLDLKLGPNAILQLINKILIPQLGGQFGMTAFISIIDTKDMTMTYANAGHNMPLLFPFDNGHLSRRKVRVLLSRGPRLGDSDRDQFEEKTLQLQEKNIVVWYTDGLLDCNNDKGELFGKRRLLDLVISNSEESSGQIRDEIVDEIMRFTGGVRQPDDITFIIGKII